MKVDYIEQGDCIELMQKIPDESIDLILCDLPYGTTHSEWDVIVPMEDFVEYGKKRLTLEQLQEVFLTKHHKLYPDAIHYFDSHKKQGLWSIYNRILKENGVIALFAQEPFASYLRNGNIYQYKFDWVWKKPQGSNFLNAKIQPLKNYELICIFGKGKIKYNPQMRAGKPYKAKNTGKNGVYDSYGQYETDNEGTRYPSSVIEFNAVNNSIRIHRNQKPIDLLEYLILTHSDKGDTVLDNTMGSGSTIIAANNTGRHWIGFEKDTDIFLIAKENITAALSQIRLDL